MSFGLFLFYRAVIRATRIRTGRPATGRLASFVHSFVMCLYSSRLQAEFALNTIGRRCARIYSSCSLGSASDRMTLPTPMKNLRHHCQYHIQYPGKEKKGVDKPKGCARCTHILAQSPHNALRSGTITENVNSAYQGVSSKCSSRLSIQCNALPKMNPIITPTARKSSVYTRSETKLFSKPLHPPIIAPILTIRL